METNSFAVPGWEDVVFENRNKHYGAYLLRKAYVKRLFSGVFVTSAIVALLIILPRYFSEPIPLPDLPIPGRGIIEYIPMPIIEREKPIQTIRPPKSNRANSAILVTRDEVVESEEEVITNYVPEEGMYGTVGTIEDTGTALAVEPPPVVLPKFVDIAEIMPVYEGGLEEIMKFVQKKIRFPKTPRSTGIEGTVYVRFIVNGDGSVSDVEVIKGVHPDYDEEAKRVIAMLPSWKGGSQNGIPIPVRMVLPIKFNVKQ